MTSDWLDPTPELLEQARMGDRAAIDRILDMYRTQLKNVVSTRLDTRLVARIDESDVVQDVCVAAFRSLPDWVEAGKPIYACLYHLTRDRLARLRRDHVAIQMRSVTREATNFGVLSDQSVVALCRRLGVRSDTPSRAAIQRESQELVRSALDQLNETDREVLVMRIIEGIPGKEVAVILGLTEAAVNMRQLRALKRMRTMLECDT